MKTKKFSYSIFCLLSVLLLALSPAVMTQSQATTGNIEGRVLVTVTS